MIKQVTVACIICIYSLSVHAESYSCPTIQQIHDRTITQQFEWTVSEQTSLDAVLNSRALLAVTIENAGEFVTCTYASEPSDVRLDAKPLGDNCTMVSEQSDWQTTADREICTEPNKLSCLFTQSCQITNN